MVYQGLALVELSEEWLCVGHTDEFVKCNQIGFGQQSSALRLLKPSLLSIEQRRDDTWLQYGPSVFCRRDSKR